MVSIADHWKVTSPAASVLRTSVLASDLTMSPVRRSPFFRVIWSAKTQVDISVPAMSKNIRILDTTTSSYIKFKEIVSAGRDMTGLPHEIQDMSSLGG